MKPVRFLLVMAALILACGAADAHFGIERAVRRGIVDNLWNEKSSVGLSGMLGYISYNRSGYYRVSNTTIGVCGALHYEFVDKLDTYTGLSSAHAIISATPSLPLPNLA